MASPPPAFTSLTEHVTPLEAGAHVVAAAFLGDRPALVLADGGILMGPAGAQLRHEPHAGGGILVATADGATLVTGGDDGRVVRTAQDGTSEILGDEKGRWIDALAASRPRSTPTARSGPRCRLPS